eukprot:symbB.v1.2.028127.t1/scaffold2919.1/size67253/4
MWNVRDRWQGMEPCDSPPLTVAACTIAELPSRVGPRPYFLGGTLHVKSICRWRTSIFTKTAKACRLRKKMDDGQLCTIRCPDARWWQVPWHAEMTCTRGLFKYGDGGDGAIVKKIECATSAVFKSIILLTILLVAFAVLVAIHFLRRKSPPASGADTAPPPPAQAVPIVHRQASASG